MTRPVSVEVGELVLEGCFEPRQAERVAAALTGELERLLRADPPEAAAEVDVAGDELRLGRGRTPEELGREAARAVHRRLTQ